MKYEIIDNFLPEEDFKKIQEVMMGNEFPWFFQKFIEFYSEPKSDGEYKNFYFTHMFFIDGMRSENIEQVRPLVEKIENTKKVKFWKRVKGNLFLNGANKSIEENKHSPHTDYSHNHSAAVYSINTNNGGTILYDNDKEIKVDSVANRIVFFEGNKLHSSMTCTDQKIRVNINFNFESDE